MEPHLDLLRLAVPQLELPPPGELLNRELAWLAFNRRVLAQALDSRVPVLERLKFLGIFSANLDEFFMKRVGGLKRQLAAGVMSRAPGELTPQQQLSAVRSYLLPLLIEQARCFEDEIAPVLASEGIQLLSWEELREGERSFLNEYFDRNVFPVLTPLSVDPGHPFPFLSNLSTSLGVALSYPDLDERLFARVKIPEVLPQWIQLPELRFVRLSELIERNLDKVFPNMKIQSVMLFRVTRNADIERDEEDAEDLLEMIEEELRQRRFAKVVRLEHGPNPDRWVLDFLTQELELSPDDVYHLPGELDYTTLKVICELQRASLKYEPWSAVISSQLLEQDSNIFNVIRRGDLLVHHPYESFSATVERFIRVAVDDPKVIAIKMTLYRTGDETPFVPLLIRAAEEGKQVVCLVEVKAHLDEERNIYWAQALEQAGVHVVYGIVGLKIHAKTALVVRQEGEDGSLTCYAHIGTGNYHAQTAKIYTDLGLFTCNRAVTDDLVSLFHFLTGRSLKRDYNRLLVAPLTMKDRLLDLVRREEEHARAGRPAEIAGKMNSLEDPGICAALYEASRAGVDVRLLVRGFSCLRPGVPGLSERIQVVSVVGRFLEHSRIFYFRNGAIDPIDGEFFIGSADLMARNLHGRVEILCPVEGRGNRERLWEILQLGLSDQVSGWEMLPGGEYRQRFPAGEQLGSQQQLMQLAKARGAGLGR